MSFGVGLYWFFEGFRVYHKYRMLADMPESRIRSLAMGLVEIQGSASGDQTLTSPLSHTSCFLYKVAIERWETDHGRGRWVHYWTDIRAVRFYIGDATGQVLVDPSGAEYDLTRRGVREIGRSRGLWGLLGLGRGQKTESGVTDQELLEYVGNLAQRSALSLDLGPEGLPQLPGLGTGGSEHLIGGTVYQQTFRLIEPASSSDRFRLTEYCIIPGEHYDVAGTCVENPQPKHDGDRHLIRQGTNETTFVISRREKRAMERALLNKAVLRIFGGAALAIVCLYLFILFARVGWI
jgi:hypothetical protein